MALHLSPGHKPTPVACNSERARAGSSTAATTSVLNCIQGAQEGTAGCSGWSLMSPPGATVTLRKAKLPGIGGGCGLPLLQQLGSSMEHLPSSRAVSSALRVEFVKKKWLHVKSEGGRGRHCGTRGCYTLQYKNKDINEK